MKKYKTPMFKPHMLKAGRLLLEASTGNEKFIKAQDVEWDD